MSLSERTEKLRAEGGNLRQYTAKPQDVKISTGLRQQERPQTVPQDAQVVAAYMPSS